MKTRLARIFCCALILFIAGAPAAFGELPPYVYKNLQDNAPEHLRIKVLSVKTKEGKDGAQVSVEAIVTKVMRSASGLRVGDVIRIEYFHSTSHVPGPGPVALLVQEQSYEAFLSRNSTPDKTYSPGARGHSFLLFP
jgi:hypothetical protein